METFLFWVIKLPLALLCILILIILEILSNLVIDTMEFFAWCVSKLLGTQDIEEE